MSAALKYLSQAAEQIFASQMQHAAQKICERQHLFDRRSRCATGIGD
ncbi:MAG TPA: hypothetical protein VH206_00890 [Xanthobacteraceae bacterium]|jgi:hypothetical protein|nr:hypothetical protein [Xanthobacteraceae bacterium]